MSFINSSTNNELSSLLSEKTLLDSYYPNFENKRNLYSYNLKHFETKNIHNRLGSLKLRGKEKYKNFSIFEKRELELNKSSKFRLNLSLKRFSTINKNKNSLSQNPIYITENIIKGDYTKLPILLEKMTSNDSKHKIFKINNNILNKKIMNKTNNINNNKSNEDISEEKKGNLNKVRVLFLNKLKYNIDREEIQKKIMSKTDSNLLIIKNVALNRHMRQDKTKYKYIDKLNQFIISKKNYEFKNEQYLQIKENINNKYEFVNDTIKTLNSSHKILEDKFLVKYNEYFRSILLDKENENNKDIMLCKYIYSLRTEIKILENKIRKLRNEKYIYERWMFLQIQIKEKLLNIPKNYILALRECNNNSKITNEETNRILKYKNNIIYKNADEIIRQLKKYENENINLILKLNENNYNNNLLKDDLEQEYLDSKDNYFIKELNNKKKIKSKLIEENKFLEKRIINIKKDLNIISNNNKNINHSKLYQKIKLLKNNIFGTNIDMCYFSIEEDEMLEMMKEIEITLDKCLKKKQLYSNKFKIKYEEEKVKLEQYKKKERIKLHQKLLHDKYIKLKEKIIQKANKVYFLPNKKINWRNQNLQKSLHSSIYNKKEIKENENNIDYIHFNSNNTDIGQK